MTEDKIFELAELLADEAFGKKGMIAYSERQELTSEFNKILVKNLAIHGAVKSFVCGEEKIGSKRCDNLCMRLDCQQLNHEAN
jgi:hypothetical protein